jgi:aromatic ring-opening dioxygenase LigB subunit
VSDPIAIEKAVLMCHAPIVLPEVAGPRAEACAQSTAAMTQAASDLVKSGNEPDLLVVLSPHTPRHRSAFGLTDGEVLAGDFGNFGAPQVGVSFPMDEGARSRIEKHAHALGMDLVRLDNGPLDHGAMVPLAFVQAAGFSGKIVLIALPWRVDHAACQALGRAINRAAREAGENGERWSILASGDMSHRLIPGAPSGHHPRAREFDAYFTEQIRQGRYRDALEVEPELRALAAEDVVDTVEIAVAATQFSTQGAQTYSYEGPFGVGYLVAMLFDSQKEEARK